MLLKIGMNKDAFTDPNHGTSFFVTRPSSQHKDSEDEPANPNIIYEELDDEAFDGGKEQTLVDGKKIVNSRIADRERVVVTITVTVTFLVPFVVKVKYTNRRDLAREGNEIIREATKWSPELAAACEVWKKIKFEWSGNMS
ncbi:hypothetical protein DCAR_0623314 [Daucus carota subsp. sativus]|uniref:Uncharacterized protein n=1 Tax=Daucus carota subsp. sativus TaxID=79200 RepID=A0AAF0X906_DAUCS|nr:hypothetical protein DCAR_0623314 [Daucus carota subsp. sativus]